MGFVIIYNDEIELEPFRTVLRNLNFPCTKPEFPEPEPYILKIHSKEYLERVKDTIFFHSAVESVKCALQSAEEIEKHETVIAVGFGAGHHAKHDDWAGYSFLNDLLILIERLNEKGYERIAVLETDSHHSDAYRICSAGFYCIKGKEKCSEVKEMKCSIARNLSGDEYVKSFRDVVGMIKSESPEVVVWYLGLDLHVDEYSEGILDDEGFREMISDFMSINARKIVLLKSWSREDVLKRVLSYFSNG